ncbi:MAG: NERD domain-containing protein [Bacilli bacterium]|nr:NERD domain-containing protein [Bacilli bacterium]
MDSSALSGLIIGVIILVIIFVLAATKNKRRGKRGERYVSRILDEYLKTHDGYVINDVIIANLNGKTSQIDHILFTPYAIFVIETKNYSGYIYGSLDQQYWTQVLNPQTKNRLFNPIKQNKTHCSRIGGILNQRYSIISCVVFAQNNIENIRGCENYVHNASDLLSYLERYKRVVFTNKRLEEMYNKINEYKIHPICTEKEHVDRIRREY